jgi:hypothetical protein
MKTGNACGIIAMALACGGCTMAGDAGSLRAVAPGATASSDAFPATCRVLDPRVVSTGAFVPAGVEARLEGKSVVARFSHRASGCVEATAYGSWTPLGLESPASCPSGARDVMAAGDSETMVAREWHVGSEAPRLKLGVVVFDATTKFLVGFQGAHARDQIVDTSFEPVVDEHGEGAAGPGLAALAGNRFLVTWVDGDVEGGHAAHAQIVEGWGSPVGPQLTLSPPDVSVIGRTSAVMRPDGVGAVLYLASSGNGFDVMATPIECR